MNGTLDETETGDSRSITNHYYVRLLNMGQAMERKLGLLISEIYE